MKAGTSSAEIVGTSTSTTSWPSSSSSAAVSRAASTQSGAVGMPSGASAISPIAQLPGAAPSSSANGRGGGIALFQASGSGPAVRSRTAAASATVRVVTPSTTAPIQVWARRGTRPRLDFRPTRPQ